MQGRPRARPPGSQLRTAQCEAWSGETAGEAVGEKNSRAPGHSSHWLRGPPDPQSRRSKRVCRTSSARGTSQESQGTGLRCSMPGSRPKARSRGCCNPSCLICASKVSSATGKDTWNHKQLKMVQDAKQSQALICRKKLSLRLKVPPLRGDPGQTAEKKWPPCFSPSQKLPENLGGWGRCELLGDSEQSSRLACNTVLGNSV